MRRQPVEARDPRTMFGKTGGSVLRRTRLLTGVAVAMPTLAIGQAQMTMASVGDLSQVMSDLKDHITGAASLTGSEREALTATFESNRDFLDDTTVVMTEAFDLSSSYESTLGPLFINAQTSGGFPRVQQGADGYELHRAIFAVQQAILDVVYSPANCQIHQQLFDGRLFETSTFFQGSYPWCPKTETIRSSLVFG